MFVGAYGHTPYEKLIAIVLSVEHLREKIMSLIRWGVLSTSQHAANTWIPALKNAARGELAAVASRDEARGQPYARQHGIPKVYGSYEALLADPDIDAVYIPLPNSLHKTWAIHAAAAGKHVLCEKPLGLNAAEAEMMVAAARKAGVKFAEAFQWRHHPQGQKVREIVRAGGIGDLRLIDAGFSFMLTNPDDVRWKPDLGGGSLYDVGCYPISLARYITGQEPKTVTAQIHWGESGVDDRLVATLEFSGGVLAHINCGFTLPLRRYYEVVGTQGSLAVNRAYNPKEDAPGEVRRYGEDRELIETITLGTLNSYTLMIEDFNAAIQNNRDPLFPAEDAISNMRVIDAIYKASREGGRMKV
jgi:xylose dehydrogenase (NAD/NADP)